MSGEEVLVVARRSADLTVRSIRLAASLDSSFCGAEHLLMMILDSEHDGPAQEALRAAGVSRSDLDHRLAVKSEKRAAMSGTSPTPRFYGLAGLATGLALAAGEEPSDHHALLALVYEGFMGELVGGERTQRIVEHLRACGVAVPSAHPPGPPAPLNLVTRIYYPASDHDAVTAEMIRRYPPPDSPKWGFNISAWKEGFHWLDADEACNAASIVRAVCADPTRILEVPFDEAAAREQATQT